MKKMIFERMDDLEYIISCRKMDIAYFTEQGEEVLVEWNHDLQVIAEEELTFLKKLLLKMNEGK